MNEVTVQTGITSSAMVPLKWFTFHQNNSGGHFVVDANVSEYVFVQAVDAESAITIAERLCDNSDSCPCCGDRWSFYVGNDDGSAEPLIWGEPLNGHSSHWVNSFARLYHFDGRIESYPPAALAITDGVAP